MCIDAAYKSIILLWCMIDDVNVHIAMHARIVYGIQYLVDAEDIRIVNTIIKTSVALNTLVFYAYFNTELHQIEVSY